MYAAVASRLLVLCLSLILLPGCAWLWQAETAQPGSAERLRAIPSWFMEGRINVRTPDDAWSANLEWRHGSNEDQMSFSGPFAPRAATLLYKENLIIFEAADGSLAESTDPEGLLLERLGFSVPLDALRYWVLGLPAPLQEFIAHPAPENPAALVGFAQAGWFMRYDGFMQTGLWVLPRKIEFRGRDVVLKLIVDRWRVDR